MTESEAYKEGREAAKRGDGLEDNPHRYDTYFTGYGAEWDRGWVQFLRSELARLTAERDALAKELKRLQNGGSPNV